MFSRLLLSYTLLRYVFWPSRTLGETSTRISLRKAENKSSFVNLKRIRKHLQRALDRPDGYSINTNQRKKNLE